MNFCCCGILIDMCLFHFRSDENWDDDQLLGFEPCNENLVTGCNIIDGKCECDSVRTCNNPFEFASQEACQTALQKIEGTSYFFILIIFSLCLLPAWNRLVPACACLSAVVIMSSCYLIRPWWVSSLKYVLELSIAWFCEHTLKRLYYKSLYNCCGANFMKQWYF